ncbi:hypothetical protein M407DRAFT_228202 [Tulasnella calospora MUT 4182]|uniref:tRNA-binding domain-containing protein n=1 Tax=Tulasnella calospora MUT 4182 TaxID=1051891 RepID=A0A0C3QPF9_9AGAM|nr:hypothetical protein M407DRAFT_228202 [Tulasnella calospora MUT 4182]
MLRALLRPPTTRALSSNDLVKSTFVGNGQLAGSGSEADTKPVDEWIDKISGGSLVAQSGSLKKKAKKDTVADAKSETAVDSKSAVSGSVRVKAQASGSSGQPKEKKAKQEKKGKKEGAAATAAGEASGKRAAGGAAAPAADAGEPSPAMIDLRVGHIVDNGLYVEEIDLGEETGPRTIISGLVNYIPIEKMQDKWLIVVRCRIVLTQVHWASHKDGKDKGIEIVDPPKGCKSGDRIYFEGEKYESKP